METNGINLFDQHNNEEKNQGRKRAFVLGAAVALTAAAALGIGAMIGSKSNDGGEEQARRTGIERPVSSGQAVEPTATTQNAGAVLGGDVEPPADNSADQPAGDSGDVEPPATNTPVPPAPTDTPVAPTDTPEPEATPTDTPTATPTADGGCVWCIDPGIIVVLDLTPPEFLSGGRTHCPEGTIVAVTLDEEADIWVEYKWFGVEQVSATTEDATFGYFNLGGGPFLFPAMNIVVHAVDAWGNESTFAPPLTDCI